MPRFINPFSDVGFKRIFGQEINKDLLIDFLNDLLVGEKEIKDITFLDKELTPDVASNRGVIYDVYCTTEQGEHIIVEMQNRPQLYFGDRALYYVARAIDQQGERGIDWHFNLKAVYGVFFINFRMDGFNELREDIILYSKQRGRQHSDKLRMIYLCLPNFRKEEGECDTNLERWIYVLKNMEILDRMPFKGRKAVFDKLEQIVNIAALSYEDRMKYDESIKVYRDQLATLSYAREEGLEEGVKIVAKNLKEIGMPIVDIQRVTHLPLEVIEQL